MAIGPGRACRPGLMTQSPTRPVGQCRACIKLEMIYVIILPPKKPSADGRAWSGLGLGSALSAAPSVTAGSGPAALNALFAGTGACNE